MTTRGYIQINLGAIRTNIYNLHNRYPDSTKIMAVIKSDGYGHGAAAIGQAIEDIDFLYGFAVATCEEAFELRNNGVNKPLLVMGPIFPNTYESIIQNEISIILYREESIEPLAKCAARLGKTVSVHLEVDTGMNRIGIKPDEQGFLLARKIVDYPEINIEGIYTHFAKADEAEDESTYHQLEEFYAFIHQLENELGLVFNYKHCSNSAGMLGLYEMQPREGLPRQTQFSPMTICRPGIAIYGIWPSNETREFLPKIELIPALSFYSQIIMVKEIKAGEAVSYGGTFVAARPTKVATVPIGYGDGYPRALSNIGYVLIRGKKAPIIGRVCMDFFMVDLTDAPDIAEGDKVTLIGTDGEYSITVEDLCDLAGLFHYELVCGLNKRVPRLYI
ncbi:MAG: alanine racemase [Lachnospiraceae bacterium]|nr:alanine racemase [Lachnospiraceae bacterium]